MAASRLLGLLVLKIDFASTKFKKCSFLFAFRTGSEGIALMARHFRALPYTLSQYLPVLGQSDFVVLCVCCLGLLSLSCLFAS